MITLLHPSRGRAYKALETMKFWMSQASGKIEIEHMISIDIDDKQAAIYNSLFKDSKLIANNNDCVVAATNIAASHSKGDILVYLSDDFKCPKFWDVLIQEKIDKDKPCLLKVDDCLQKFHVPVLTIPIMNRKLYERLGYFWHPGYKSMFVDEDLYWVCKRNNWMKDAPTLRFPHEHCSNGKATNDETYKRSSANWNQGKMIFRQRQMQGFPI